MHSKLVLVDVISCANLLEGLADLLNDYRLHPFVDVFFVIEKLGRPFEKCVIYLLSNGLSTHERGELCLTVLD